MEKIKPRYCLTLSEGDYAILSTPYGEIEIYMEDGELKTRECIHDYAGRLKKEEVADGKL